MFKVGDKIKLKNDISRMYEDAFNNAGIYKNRVYTIANIKDEGGIGIEGGWEKRGFRRDVFELISESRKDRINNLYKEEQQ